MPAQSTDGPTADAAGTVSTSEAPPSVGTGQTEGASVDGGENPQDATPDKANREAARYRTQLRETESERDGLRGQLDVLRRAEVTRLAGAQLADGADLFRHTDAELATFLAEDGTVDAAKVTEAVKALAADRPYLTGRRFLGSADQGGRSSPASAPPRLGAIFSRDTR